MIKYVIGLMICLIMPAQSALLRSDFKETKSKKAQHTEANINKSNTVNSVDLISELKKMESYSNQGLTISSTKKTSHLKYFENRSMANKKLQIQTPKKDLGLSSKLLDKKTEDLSSPNKNFITALSLNNTSKLTLPVLRSDSHSKQTIRPFVDESSLTNTNRLFPSDPNYNYVDYDTSPTASIPEPTAMTLIALTGGVLLLIRRRVK